MDGLRFGKEDGMGREYAFVRLDEMTNERLMMMGTRRSNEWVFDGVRVGGPFLKRKCIARNGNRQALAG
jgi:hypothetical protein